MPEEIIKYKLPNNEEIGVLSNQLSIKRKADEGFEMAGSGEKIIDYASETFEKSLEKLKTFSQLVANSLKEASPDELKVEFGVTFSAEAGVLISLGSEFNVKVEMTWKKSSPIDPT